MDKNRNTKSNEFDAYADDYESALDKGISISGEKKDYFASQRVSWLAKCLIWSNLKPAKILDFGCGTGTSTPFLLSLEGCQKVTGIDISHKSIVQAKKQYGSKFSEFLTLDEYTSYQEYDLAFCNGVFHHIPLNQRVSTASLVFNSLKKGGFFAFWENNPWNPGTRYIMKKIPFDRDAITLNVNEAVNLLKSVGFDILSKSFLFYFPRSLSVLRFMEPYMTQIPLGAQYMVLCKRPT